MAERWLRATHESGAFVEGRVVAPKSNGAGYFLEFGKHSSAFLNHRDGWMFTQVPGPLDPASPLGVAVAAYFDDWKETIGSDTDYFKGYVDLLCSIREREEGPSLLDDAEARQEMLEILARNLPKK